MYDKEIVARLLPGVCWTHHLHTTQNERGRAGTCTRNESFWAAPPRPKPTSSIDPAQYRYIDWPSPADIDQMDDKTQRTWKARIERSVDPGKRKSFSNPKQSNTVWAELIDVQIGWDTTTLTEKERIALYLFFSEQKWTQDEIAYNQDVDQSAISRRIDTAINKIVAQLNGSEWAEELEAA